MSPCTRIKTSAVYFLAALICSFSSYSQFTESFESGQLPAGWKIINVSGGSAGTWYIKSNETPLRAYHGSKMMAIDGNFGSTAPAHNDYLITPPITVLAGVNDYLSFYALNNANMHYSDVFDVKVSATGTEIADFTDVLASQVKAPTSWTEYGYDLSAYAGKTIYIAIHNDTYDGGKWFYVDYFVNKQLPPPPAGCTTAGHGKYPSSTVNATVCTGTPKIITDEGYAGEYSTVRLTGGENYIFSSSVSSDYLTISTDNSSKTVLAHGITPLSYTPAANTTIRLYNHTGSGCGSEERIRTRSVTCGTPVSPNANDEASGAIEIAVGAGCNGGGYDISNATAAPNEPQSGCGLYNGPGDKTLWFKFTAPASGTVKITMDFAGFSFEDPKMALYETADPSDYSTFTNLACDDDGGIHDGGWKPVIFHAGLNAGQTYYVQVEEYYGFYDGTFCLEVHEISAAMLSGSESCEPNDNSVFGGAIYSGWISLTDDDGKLIALVRNSAGMPSDATSEAIHIHQGPIRQDHSGNHYLNRNFSLNNSGSGPYEVILFFLKSELDALSAVAPSVNINTLKITRQAGSQCTADFDENGISSSIPLTSGGLSSEVGWVKFTTPSFSSFFLHGPAAPLPVTWVRFKTESLGHQIFLQWTTTEETNNKGFSIERGTDAIHFTAVGWVDGAHTSSGTINYTFIDGEVQPGTIYYYRIRQVDSDGSSSVSEIRSARTEEKDILVVPNPAKDKVLLYLPSANGGLAGISLIDKQGRNIRQWSKPAEQVVPLELGSLSPDIYFIKVMLKGRIYTQRLLIE